MTKRVKKTINKNKINNKRNQEKEMVFNKKIIKRNSNKRMKQQMIN